MKVVDEVSPNAAGRDVPTLQRFKPRVRLRLCVVVLQQRGDVHLREVASVRLCLGVEAERREQPVHLALAVGVGLQICELVPGVGFGCFQRHYSESVG